jgi:hypothetical protein
MTHPNHPGLAIAIQVLRHHLAEMTASSCLPEERYHFVRRIELAAIRSCIRELERVIFCTATLNTSAPSAPPDQAKHTS